MKKAIILFMAATLLAIPALIMNFSLQNSTSLMQQEYEKQLTRKLEQELDSQSQTNNITFEAVQNLTFFMQQANQIKYLTEAGAAKDQLVSLLASYSASLHSTTGFSCETSVAVNCDGVTRLISYNNGHKVENNSLEKLTALMMQFQLALQNKAPTLPILEALKQLLNSEFKIFFNLYFFKTEFTDDINRIVLRETGSFKTLITIYRQNAYVMNALFDLSKVTNEYLAQLKTALWKSHETGLICVTTDQKKKIFSSSYFYDKPELLRAIIQTITSADSHKNNLRFKIADHIILAADNDPKRPYRVITTAKSPSIKTQSHLLLLPYLFAILSLSLLKLIVEAVIFDRTIQISLRNFIIGIFILVAMLPLLSSIYISNEYVVSSFKREKNRAAVDLSNQLLNLDLETFTALRNSINKLKSLNSVETIAAFAEMPPNTEITTMMEAVLNKLLRINQKPLFSEVWIYEEGQTSLFGLELRNSLKYVVTPNNKNIMDEIFIPKFREYLAQNRNAGEPEDRAKKNQAIELNEIKSEILDDILLNLFGEKTYFQIRENFGSLISFESCFDNNSLISIPIKENGRTRYIFSWVFNSSEIKRHFPVHKLSTEEDKPVIINVFGSEKVFESLPEKINILKKKFPTLMKLALQSHISSSRQVMQENLASGSASFETHPARHSGYIICGQINTRSLEAIQSELGNQALRHLLAITAAGLVFALLTSLYFTIPIKHLTEGTRAIIDGDYSIRVGSDHPDEFATAAIAFNKMAIALEEGKLLSSFVSDSVKAIAAKTSNDLGASATLTTATILFSSIKNFSDMQKSFEPEKVFAAMQAHLSSAVAATNLFGGEIDKMIEDKVMIVFAAEGSTRSEQSAAAIKAALHISSIMSKDSEIITAAGINTGEVVSGVMGAANVRLSKTVAGDPVNLAARLAAEAGKLSHGGIVISGQVCEHLPAGYSAAKLPINTVKGKTQTIEAYLLQ